MKLNRRVLVCLLALGCTGLVPLAGHAAGGMHGAPEVYQPLKPANMGSPRDTINSFLKDYGMMLEEHFREGEVTSREGMAAYDRAVSTLNFSNTPDGGARWVQTERLVYLKEVLDKLQLPPQNEIPGPAEVAAEGLTEWRIPGTRITLSRTEYGLFEGEWQFSARTVQMLPRFYRQMRELPYQPGATEGLYENVQANRTGIINREREVGNRLRAVNTDSPRSTLEGFMMNMNKAYDYAFEVHQALSAKPPTMTINEAKSLGRLAEGHMARAVATLDLSAVPEALRYDSGIESAMQIKEVLDRLAPPPIDQIPDVEMVRRMRREMGNSDRPIRWVYPNTALEIVEVMDGSENGTFKFSPTTIAMSDHYYEMIKDLPYRDSHIGHFSAQYESAATSPGFYQFYATTPGNLIPLATTWGRIINKLPPLFHAEYLNQPLWKWCATLLAYLLAFMASIGMYFAIRRLGRSCPAPISSWLRLITPLVVAGILYWVTRYITNEINITGNAILTIIMAERTIGTFLLAWAAFCLCRALAETVIALPQIKEESIDASLLRLSSRIIGIIFAAWVIVSGLSYLGLDVWPIVAGLGVGGLAVALAFRPTMENIIGSFMIFADKPYKVGQRVKVLDADGTVEAIGLRSTKIRLLSGHLTTIPNEKMASVVIENIGQRPFIRRVFDINIPCDTPPEKINRAVDIVRGILAVSKTHTDPGAANKAHPNVAINQPDFLPRVYFNTINSDSLNIAVTYWYHPPVHWEFLEHANWVNVQIMEKFAAEGIGLAFPTQTVHLAGDPQRPFSIGQHREKDENSSSPVTGNTP